MGAVVRIGKDKGVQSGVYNIPFDEEEIIGWDKKTIRYIMDNQDLVRSNIVKFASKYTILSTDIDDICMDTYVYFCRHNDYDIGKAVERGKDNTVTSLEGYVNKCIECIVKNFYTARGKYVQHIVPDEIEQPDGNKVSLIDSKVSSSQVESEGLLELEEICRIYESKRNIFGYDLFTLMYIQIILMMYDIKYKESDIDELLELFDIRRDDTITEDTMDIKNSVAKALSICMYDEAQYGADSVERAAGIVKRFVYGSEQIDKAVYEFVAVH